LTLSAKARVRALPSRRFVLTHLEESLAPDRRPGLMRYIETQVDILFAEERAVADLTGAVDLAAACAWMSKACAFSVLSMGADGVVIFRNGEQTFGPPAPHFEIAPYRYADGFLDALEQGHDLESCALMASRAAADVATEIRRLARTSASR